MDDTFVEVSEKVFFNSIGRLNVHPSPSDPAYSTWKFSDQSVAGFSWPGWKNPGDPEKYMVHKRWLRKQ